MTGTGTVRDVFSRSQLRGGGERVIASPLTNNENVINDLGTLREKLDQVQHHLKGRTQEIKNGGFFLEKRQHLRTQ